VTEGDEALGDMRGVELGVRVGIATGLVVVGDLIGEGASQESAVVGETPNLAARLQALASLNTVVIPSATHELAAGSFEYDDLGTHALKGISEPVHAWRVIAPSTAESRFEASHRTGLTPLVGRAHEIGLLLERWQQAKEGDGELVLLSGEAGIGKSRITETLRERTATDNPVRLSYQCSPYHTNSALHPVIAQLERAAQFDSEDTRDAKLDKLESLLAQGASDVEAVAPLVAALMSIPSEGRYAPLEMTPERQKEQTLEALVSQIEGLSRIRPVLLIFEDVHWADPTSIELLGLIVGRTESLPALAVITHRPDFSPPWTGHSHVTSLTLNRFSRSLATTMIDRVTGSKPLPDEVRDQIIEKTDGVPLFVEELTKTVVESGLLEDRGSHYALVGPLPALAIPSTLHDSLMARLDRLAPVREVAQAAAVIGREFSHGLLAAVSPLTQNALRHALDQLVDAALIFRLGTPPRVRYVFKHALVRDAAYASLLKSKRRELHGRIAQALESGLPEIVDSEPELLAHHYTEAGFAEPALAHWLRAGKAAVEHGAYPEAVAHLRRGLTLLETLAADEARARMEIEFRVALGVPLIGMEGARSPAVAENYQRARTLCEEMDESEQLFPVLWGLWFHALMDSELREACGLADELLAVGQRRDDEALRLEAHHCQWASRLLVGEFMAALEHTERGTALYRAKDHHALSFTFGGHDPGACALAAGSLALWLTGFPTRARERFDEAVALSQKLGHVGTLSNEVTFGMTLALFEGDRRAFEQWTEVGHGFASIERISVFQAFVELARAWLMFEGGDREAALERLRHWAKSLLGQDPWYIPLITLAASALGKHGDIDEGLDLVDEILRIGRRDNVHWWEAELLRAKGELLGAVNGDTAAAERCFYHAIEVARLQGAKSLELRAATSLARLCQNQGKRDEARDLLAPVYDWFSEGLDTADLMEAKALLDSLPSKATSSR
jgi:tetratricopeptide (TPR) repeat protein